ncbi:hypothetical protein [Nostoc sp. UHCC 0252]|uniref:hypothetical protein n=1 Tax=Nostoc sp. UHCC 0252 TaxID=3110241 RepID=UPI002B215297|nr:hypothetical protein [Nostoc sp. UHCC 0252]MEA5601708.1 hypothetical protein [Nostoc sp. UHCC 0252]
MKTKVFGFALMLSLATILGACDGGGTPTPSATGEPTDAPAATPAITPAITPATTPAATPK